MAPIYWGRLLVIYCSISPSILKNNIGPPQYYLIGGVVLGRCWRCSKVLKKKRCYHLNRRETNYDLIKSLNLLFAKA
jgi:hypothetical protein